MTSDPPKWTGQPPASDLLSPSLQEHTPEADRPRAWRFQSQFWVAFFGGVLPYSVIAFLNARRLKLPPERQRLFVLISVAGLILTVALDYIAVTGGLFPGVRSSTVLRFSSRIIAVIAYVIGAQIQRPADRVYQLASGGEYASLWKPGLAATLGLGFLQNIAVFAVVYLLTGGAAISSL